jgi:monothiol glutaredoxin
MTDGLDERGLPIDYQFKHDWEITPRDAKSRLDQGEGVILLDVRVDEEIKTASVRGATHIPLSEIALRIDELPDDDEQMIATLCHRGRRSLQAAALLREYGYRNTYSVAGGIDLWARAADPAVPRYTRVAGQCRLI